MTAASLPVRYVVNDRELELLKKLLFQERNPSASTPPQAKPSTVHATQNHSHAAAFRSASRVFVLTYGSLNALQLLLGRLTARSRPPGEPRKSIVASNSRAAFSLAALLYFHQVLFRVFTRLRLQLLHERVRSIRERYPRIYAGLTSKLTPAIGASLSGLALGIFPADQLRLTIVIYVACRALEIGYAAIEHLDFIRQKPSWIGSWLLFALAQGQLLHAFVFDNDCFPEAYGSFILGFTPEYIPKRPENLSPLVSWPSSRQIVDALGQMAILKWPPFVSPITHPGKPSIPERVDPAILPITSSAHPALQHLSCALTHPSEPSCFMAYLRHNLLSFPQVAKFYTMYYGAFSLLSAKKFVKSPIMSLNRLSESILRSAVTTSGAIGAAWGSICFFQYIFPRAFLPKFRFFLGGLLGGMFALVDRTSTGHANSLYVARTSVDSLWKVGKKHGWWKPFKNGDVILFAAALALVNVVYEMRTGTAAEKDRAMSLIKVLRGEVELGLHRKPGGVDDPTMDVKEDKQL